MSAIGFHDLKLDYLARWIDRINAVTLAQVRDALRRRIHPQRLVTVVAGALPDAGADADPATARSK